MSTRTIIALLCLLSGVPAAFGQAIATTVVEEAALEEQTEQTAAGRSPRMRGSDPLRSEVFIAGHALEKDESFKRWTVVPSFSYSFFNQGRDSWQEEDIQIFYQVNKQLLLGVEIDLMQRPPSGNDELYSAMASWYPVKYLEVHGKVSFSPNGFFAPNQIYQGGVEYQLLPRIALLFDFQQLNFAPGPLWETSISQVKPGVSFWITDKSFVTFRYARGWAYGTQTYNYYAGTLNIGDMPGGGRLTMGFAYGTDPDLDFETMRSSLSNAYIYTLFYTQPLTRDLSIFGGAQYVYRLREKDNSELYQQLTPTLGFAWKF